ncbi:hypothetical protein AGLY_010375 [Aphis glycines]|uniref:Uncharacterized protein n=1 Tax=Aphis glycines TaxID=307491 RepID=A0A6G0TFW2_APHGL|nr:hypothetical protein AGLY_010375 [Aphis glycines]
MTRLHELNVVKNLKQKTCFLTLWLTAIRKSNMFKYLFSSRFRTGATLSPFKCAAPTPRKKNVPRRKYGPVPVTYKRIGILNISNILNLSSLMLINSSNALHPVFCVDNLIFYLKPNFDKFWHTHKSEIKIKFVAAFLDQKRLQILKLLDIFLKPTNDFYGIHHDQISKHHYNISPLIYLLTLTACVLPSFRTSIKLNNSILYSNIIPKSNVNLLTVTSRVYFLGQSPQTILDISVDYKNSNLVGHPLNWWYLRENLN